MRYFAVIDTNVIVSALLNRASTPGMVLEEALTGRIIPLLHDDILDEYSDVLRRQNSSLTGGDRNCRCRTDQARDLCRCRPSDRVFAGPGDAVFYQVVMEARNTDDAYLVTGNLKHFRKSLLLLRQRRCWRS